jgi:hypothetical protein
MRTFVVHDASSQRILMVLVFPSVQDAGLFRAMVATHQESTGSDPPIVPGYGPSVWSGNIALIESSESNLAQVVQLQADQDNGVYHDPSATPDPRTPDITVDLDFQQALRTGVVNL